MSKQLAKFMVNGRPYEILIEPQDTLLEVLRNKLGLAGTKEACGIGECGACNVMLDGKLIRSCVTLAITAREKNILTIEGVAHRNNLHQIQQAFIDSGAIQCGFCTPGMILTTKALLEKAPNPSKEEVEECLVGNLCRCTGYVKIIDAVLLAGERMRKGGD